MNLSEELNFEIAKFATLVCMPKDEAIELALRNMVRDHNHTQHCCAIKALSGVYGCVFENANNALEPGAIFDIISGLSGP